MCTSILQEARASPHAVVCRCMAHQQLHFSDLVPTDKHQPKGALHNEGSIQGGISTTSFPLPRDRTKMVRLSFEVRFQRGLGQLKDDVGLVELVHFLSYPNVLQPFKDKEVSVTVTYPFHF